jgi:lysophospholipase L1-like esterase
MVEQALGISIVNKSRFGCTVEKGYQLLTKSLDQGLDCDLVVLEYGGNDCDFDWAAVAADPTADHQPHTPLPRFMQTLQHMVDLLVHRGIRPVLMSLPPICAERYFNFIVGRGVDRVNLLTFLGDVQQIYRHHELYSLAITRLADRSGCLYAPVRETFLTQGHRRDLICGDGIHPNADGHRIMQQVFTDLGQNLAPNLAF